MTYVIAPGLLTALAGAVLFFVTARRVVAVPGDLAVVLLVAGLLLALAGWNLAMPIVVMSD